MMWRLKDVPKYSVADSRVEAVYFNKIRLALRRLPGPIRLQLKHLKNMDMIIDEDSWVCVDTSLHDLPIVAWTDFRTEGRDNLHEPIECRLSYYHFKAALLVHDALSITDELLTERLLNNPPGRRLVITKRRNHSSTDRRLFVVS